MGLKTWRYLGNALRFLQILYFLRFRFFSATRSLLKFRQGLGIGNNTYKISVRFQEISKSIDKLIYGDFVALEFGSGSSTILLYSHPRVSRLISIEEDRRFLPSIRVTAKEWISPELTIRKIDWHGYQSKVFSDANRYTAVADLIYIDGPSTNRNDSLELAEPNLELLLFEGLTDKLILIDCRTLTVCELSRKLEDSHQLIPSKAVLREYGTFLSGKKEFQYFKFMSERGLRLAEDALGFYPIRTSILVPKKQISSYLLEARRR